MKYGPIKFLDNGIVIMEYGKCIEITNIPDTFGNLIRPLYEENYDYDLNKDSILCDTIIFSVNTELSNVKEYAVGVLNDLLFRKSNIYKLSLKTDTVNVSIDKGFLHGIDKQITHLELCGCSWLHDCIEDIASNIKSLEVSNFYYYYDKLKLFDIEFDNLESLTLRCERNCANNAIEHVIRMYQNITYFDIEVYDVDVLENIKLMKNLEHLRIMCYELQDLPICILDELPNLTSLDISRTQIYEDTYRLCSAISTRYPNIKNAKVPPMLVY